MKINTRVPITTTLDLELKRLCIEEKIEVNQALDFGVRFLLAERKLIDYPKCSLLTKMNAYRDELEEALRE